MDNIVASAVGLSLVQESGNERDRCLSNPFLKLPLAQTVDTLKGMVDFMGPYHAACLKKEAVRGNGRIPFKELSPQKIPLPQTIFSNRHMETVPDDHPKPLKLNQIKKSDADYFLDLYRQIREGSAKLQISGSEEFQKMALKHIATLLTRPAGRLLIGSICSLKRKTIIQSASTSATRMYKDDSRIHVLMNFTEKTYPVCVDPAKRIVFKENPPFLTLAHELIHALHFDWKKNAKTEEESKLDFRSASPDPSYTNLNEQLTISGLADEEDLLSENLIRCEFNMLPRKGHLSSDFPSFTPDDQASIDVPNERGITRLENAVNLEAWNEIEVLLKAGADPASGFAAAVLDGSTEMIEFMVGLGADVNAPDLMGNSALHTAAEHNRLEVIPCLIENGAKIRLQNERGLRPIDLALKNNNLRFALLLVQNGARLDKKALQHLSVEIPAAVRIQFLKIGRTLERARIQVEETANRKPAPKRGAAVEAEIHPKMRVRKKGRIVQDPEPPKKKS